MFRRSQTPGRTAEQLLLMRRAGLLVGQTLELLRGEIRPGVTTLALDALAEDFIRSHGGIPNFQLVPGYAHTLCTSVNDEVVHGIPSTVPGAPRGRPGVGRLRRRARGLERGRRLLGRRRRPRRRPPGGPAPHRRHRGRPLGRHHRAGRRWPPVCGGRGGRGEHRVRGCRRRTRVRDHRGVRRARDRAVHARGPADPQLRGARQGADGAGRVHRGDRADGDPREAVRPTSSPTTGRSPPTTGRGRRTGSTRSP